MLEQPAAGTSVGLFAFPDQPGPMHTVIRLAFSIALVTWAAACSSSGRTGAPARPAPVEPPSAANLPPIVPPMAPAPPAAPFSHAAGAHTYLVENEAIIRAANGPSRTDTVRARFVITYRLTTRGDSTLVEGTVDTAIVSSTGFPPHGMVTTAAGTDSTAGAYPFSFTMAPDGVVMSPGRDSATVCASVDIAAVATARDLLVSVPVLLGQGTQWTDSAVTTSCRGMVPVVTRAVRTAVVAWALVPETILPAPPSSAGQPAYRVLRTSTTTLGGEGPVAGRHVTITGTGSSSNALYLDPLRGFFLGSVGDAMTRLFVDTGAARQEFEQRVHQRVVRLR